MVDRGIDLLTSLGLELDLRMSVGLEYGPTDECRVGVWAYGRVLGWSMGLRTSVGLEVWIDRRV